MNFSELGNFVAKSAPILGTALLGPAGGVVGSLISNIFGGSTSNPKDLLDKISADPDHDIKLKTLENQHAEFLLSNSSSDHQAEMIDTQDARKREIDFIDKVGHRDWMLPILAVFITGGFFSVLIAIMSVQMDVSDHDVLYMLVGALGATFTQVYQYYFGSAHQKNK